MPLQPGPFRNQMTDKFMLQITPQNSSKKNPIFARENTSMSPTEHHLNHTGSAVPATLSAKAALGGYVGKLPQPKELY